MLLYHTHTRICVRVYASVSVSVHPSLSVNKGSFGLLLNLFHIEQLRISSGFLNLSFSHIANMNYWCLYSHCQYLIAYTWPLQTNITEIASIFQRVLQLGSYSNGLCTCKNFLGSIMMKFSHRKNTGVQFFTLVSSICNSNMCTAFAFTPTCTRAY